MLPFTLVGISISFPSDHDEGGPATNLAATGKQWEEVSSPKKDLAFAILFI
jgi:hypothetical protein